MITSRNNELVKRANSLKEKKYRTLYGEYIVEGRKQIREAIGSGQEIVEIFYSAEYRGERFACGREIEVSESVFAKLSEEVAPQGVLAVLKIPYRQISAPENSALLLDGISDPGNLGTIIRTANAAGITDLYLRNCADPYAPKCVRSAMSGTFFVNLFPIQEEDLAVFDGVSLICADMSGEDVFSFQPPLRFCLVIGNEANGVSEKVRKMCSYTVRIPMRSTCESLNAAVSAGILMYQMIQKQ